MSLYIVTATFTVTEPAYFSGQIQGFFLAKHLIMHVHYLQLQLRFGSLLPLTFPKTKIAVGKTKENVTRQLTVILKEDFTDFWKRETKISMW